MQSLTLIFFLLNGSIKAATAAATPFKRVRPPVRIQAYAGCSKPRNMKYLCICYARIVPTDIDIHCEEKVKGVPFGPYRGLSAKHLLTAPGSLVVSGPPGTHLGFSCAAQVYRRGGACASRTSPVHLLSFLFHFSLPTCCLQGDRTQVYLV